MLQRTQGLTAQWPRWESRLERAILAAGMTMVAFLADFVLSRRLRQ